jgi:stage III sporulation protein SpoIIIAA
MEIIAPKHRAPRSPEDSLDLLLGVMPPHIREVVEADEKLDNLLEIVLDLGRLPEARYPERVVELSSEFVTREDISYVLSKVGRFGDDNRAGIERTLHRVSAIRNRAGAVIGLTCRVGRAVFGTVDILRDVIEAGDSLLLLGRPGVGKTTLLREAARVLADELLKRVIIVDTSNEIGGDGDIPHPGIGRARRMQVVSPGKQHAVMIEAVENHMPEVIVIDEIGTEAEALAARTIAERGVQLIATVHGNTLDNLLQNPTLSDLVGGIHPVTLSDEEARRRRTQKTVLERKGPPTFNVLIEIQDKDRLAVYHGLAQVVDGFLRGVPLEPEVRTRGADGKVEVRQKEPGPEPPIPAVPQPPILSLLSKTRRKQVRIFPFGVSRIRLDRAIRKFRVPATIVEDVDKADIILTLKSQEKRQSGKLKNAEARGVPFHIIKSNTTTQLENFLRTAFDLGDRAGVEDVALVEAETAIRKVLNAGRPVELSPQDSQVRRLQHMLAETSGVSSQSEGRGPQRRVIIYPLRES